jgi:hypothetical protein
MLYAALIAPRVLRGRGGQGAPAAAIVARGALAAAPFHSNSRQILQE